MQTSEQIETQVLEASRAEYERLIAIGWSRRDAARHTQMFEKDARQRLRVAEEEIS